MTDLHVVAVIPGKPEAADDVRAALTTLAEATRQEEGCVSYALSESKAEPGTFVTVEVWKDQAAMDAHMTTPHVAAAFATVGDKMAGAVAVHPLEPVG